MSNALLALFKQLSDHSDNPYGKLRMEISSDLSGIVQKENGATWISFSNPTEGELKIYQELRDMDGMK